MYLPDSSLTVIIAGEEDFVSYSFVAMQTTFTDFFNECNANIEFQLWVVVSVITFVSFTSQLQ